MMSPSARTRGFRIPSQENPRRRRCTRPAPGRDARRVTESPSGSAGVVLCYLTDAGTAAIAWSLDDDTEPVLGRATAEDGDLAALYAWWRDVGRLAVDP